MKGLSAIEFLIASFVVVILAALIAAAFFSFRDAQELSRATESLQTLMVEARSRTLSSENASQFGVHIETGRAVLFRGASFTEGAPDNKDVLFPARVEAYSITFPQGNVVFERLTGRADSSGEVKLRLRADTAASSTIRVEESGLIYAQ